MKPFEADNKATVIYHNSFVVMPNKAVVSELEARGIDTNCKNYKTLRGEKVYPDLEKIVEPYHFFSDHPSEIVSDIIAAIKNPEVRLVIFPNGGNGMAEIIDLIEQEKLKGNLPERNDIFFVGFSDTEKAINYLAHNCGFGQAIISSRVTGKNLEEIVDSISKEGSQIQRLKPVNMAAKTSDELIGNLISASCDEHDEGYSRIEPLEGDIVFLENFPRNFKEQLEIYAKKGLLPNIQAFALSSNFPEKDLEIINEEAEKIFKKYEIAPIPIFYGIDCGHGIPNDKSKHLLLQTAIAIKKDGKDSFAEISNLRTDENIRTTTTQISEREKFVRFESRIRMPEEYRAKQLEDELFCHTINTAYGQRAEGIKDVIRKNPTEKFSVTINMPDFRDFNPDDIGMRWFKELNKEQQDKWMSDQQIKAIQMCVMDLKLSGYTDNIKQLTIASRLDFPVSVKEWLNDFQKRILTEIPCQTKVSDIENPQETSLRNSIDERFFNQEKMLHKRMEEALDLAIQQKPSTGPARTYVEKMVEKSKSGVSKL